MKFFCFALGILTCYSIQAFVPEPKDLFKIIYDNNLWVNRNTRSGSGSDLPETPIIRIQIPELLKKINARSLLDAGCGEFYWLKEVDISFLDFYLGVDIVDEIIKNNILRYGSEKITFAIMDIRHDKLPTIDVILCRDVLQHYTDENVKKIINNIKRSGALYLLTSTFRDKKANIDPATHDKVGNALVTGNGRNLEIAPFNFPLPVFYINEGFKGKTLGLWKISELPDYPEPKSKPSLAHLLDE